MTTAVRVYKKLRGLRLQILYFITRDVKHFIQNELTKISLHKKMKFSIKDFFSKCDQIIRKHEEILDGKVHFLRSVTC